MNQDHPSNPKVEIIGADQRSQTFVLRNEDHTLGNALRYVLIKNPDVKFCGYSIPHPSENIMNVRVETYGKPAAELFKKALLDLKDMAQFINTRFGLEVESYKAMNNETEA
ncbi:DNA-directed RNA polymerases I and III subunit RPAC2 [Gracilariopsis chorda]|uniref:DNA-directed RNA polymerases I and III subunit RPAC2 n=1 Tax=Gracilariopsis chorda TaxID=448386 RepID=A0A2V3J6Q0_9FLOR|nr:DNA-directed RNA polymerases I and III subunit RPAC2 [Gracilariopsis chorda]|eukprot:PXF49812.1 DNA-directed RNA polymerases I and III subunit RPAC2 [Gracilariopsis chorda]